MEPNRPPPGLEPDPPATRPPSHPQGPPQAPQGAPPTAEPPASPPLPKPHTPVTPGPRAARLQELYAQRLRHTLNKLGWENFAGCYPTVAKRAEGVLRQVQGQMVGKLGEKCEKEFDNIMVSRQVVPKLNDLESLISDAARRRNEAAPDEALPIPPHLHPPQTILAAHLTPALTAHQSQLNAHLQNTQSQNALLFEEVQRQRGEIAALLERLESVVADVKGANEALGEVVGEVVKESREGAVEQR
ncbi:Fc.00g110740.m01.CDS01 [Cosmosporella sp. VM-42]